MAARGSWARAAHLNEILVGRFNRSYQKLFGLKGPPPVATLAPEIMPSHVLFSGVEERYAQGWNKFAVGIGVAPVAAQTSDVRLRNPAGSNVIAVIEQLYGWESIADTAGQGLILRQGVITSDYATIVATSRLDPRIGTATAASALIASKTNNGSVAGNIIQAMPAPAGALPAFPFITTDIQELVLLPGDGLELDTTVQNTQLNVSVMWRERFLEESERA